MIPMGQPALFWVTLIGDKVKVKSSKIKSTYDASLFNSRALVKIKNKVANSEVVRLTKDYELSFLKTNNTQHLEKEPEWEMFGGSSDVHHDMANLITLLATTFVMTVITITATSISLENNVLRQLKDIIVTIGIMLCCWRPTLRLRHITTNLLAFIVLSRGRT